jgi:hypothetical protein
MVQSAMLSFPGGKHAVYVRRLDWLTVRLCFSITEQTDRTDAEQ